jgi:hypothetical protein
MRSLLSFFLLACVEVSAQIVVHVNDNKPVTLTPVDLAPLPRHSAVLKDHGKQATYEGALLHDVLVKAGVDFGTGLHGKQLSSYAAALGTDGYEAVFPLAELDPTVVDSNIIVADKRDGQPLGGSEGGMRIVAPNDKRPTRSVRMLHEIDVVQLRK